MPIRRASSDARCRSYAMQRSRQSGPMPRTPAGRRPAAPGNGSHERTQCEPQGLDLRAEIDRLRKERNAVILAHYYQDARDPGPRRFRRRQPRSVAQGGGDRRRRDRLLRRPLHGRDGEDPVAREDRRAARHGRRLQPRGQLPARPVQGLPRGPSGPYRADLHQLLGRGEGAERHHRHQLVGRDDPRARSRRTRRSSSAPTSISAAISPARSGATCCSGRACASSTRRSPRPSCSS